MRPSQLPPPNLCQICAKYVGAAPPGPDEGKTDCVVDVASLCVPPPHSTGPLTSADVQPYVVRENGHFFLRAPKQALN
jgi:hypothetical protein